MTAMRTDDKYHKFLCVVRVAALFLLLFLPVFLIQVRKESVPAYGKEKDEDALQEITRETQALSFSCDYVRAGEPLQVTGAPENSDYQWSITGADGSQRTFTTEEGSYTPTEEDQEKLITVTVGETSASVYFSSLPVMYITSATGYSGVGDDFSEAYMYLQGNEDFTEAKELYSGNINIKLRGNSTKMREKRPFNIKLDSKADLLKLGENKHFALLANDIDHTLMRNKLLYDFSGAIGMETYSKSENIVLIYNQEYYGVYQLCELVDLGADRVDIYDWEESAEDAAEAITQELKEQGKLTKEEADTASEELETAMTEDLSWITSPYTFTYDADEDGVEEAYTITDYADLPEATGGALLEMDFYAFGGENASTMVSAYAQPLYFKSPEYAITNPSFFHYIYRYVQSFEYALHSADFTYHEDSIKYSAQNRTTGGSINSGYTVSDFTAPEYDGKHYSQLFDMDSLVDNFIVCEYSMNWDSMKNSVFMYKDIDGLFHMGPEWDFDWAWGNINMYGTNTWYPASWHTTEDDFTKEQYYQTVQWNRCLIRDPYFLVRVYEKYHEIRETVIEDMIKDEGTIDSYEKQLEAAGAANDERWSYTYARYKSVGFEDSVKNMREFIDTRVAWLDEQFASIDTLMTSLGYYKPSDELKVAEIDTKAKRGNTVVTVSVTDQEIASVSLLLNGTNRYTAKVTSGQAVFQIPDSVLIKTADILNVIQISAVDVKGDYIVSTQDKGNYSLAKSNYAVFYSSAQAIGTPGFHTDVIKWCCLVVIITAVTGLALIFILYNRRK